MRRPGPKGRYIFEPPGCSTWHIRFQYPKTKSCPKGRKVVFSLGTTDEREAVKKSQPLIDMHILALREHKEDGNPNARRAQAFMVRPKYNVGYTTLPDGTCVFVPRGNPGIARLMREDGSEAQIDNQEEVIVPGLMLTEAEYRAGVETDTLDVADPETGEPRMVECPQWRDRRKLKPVSARPRAPERNADDPDRELLKSWIDGASVTPHIEREARLTFEAFKQMTEGKRFDQCGYAEGSALVSHLLKTNAWPTVRKKVGHLRAAVNFALKRDLYNGRNPFANVMPKQRPGDIKKRGFFDDDDMALVRSRAKEVFSESEWRLWVLLATTGMRLSEAVGLQGEKTERGIRYVEIEDGKTLQSQRRVPLPSAYLALWPEKITGPLFPGETAPALSKRMNRRLDQIGITDERKVIHCLRHRAKDKLRAGRVKIDMQYELLGHEKKTVAAGYGHGYPMSVLKPLIDKIGY